MEVESVAFVVLDALGLASDDYSFPYVARWASGDLAAVRATASGVIESNADPCEPSAVPESAKPGHGRPARSMCLFTGP